MITRRTKLNLHRVARVLLLPFLLLPVARLSASAGDNWSFDVTPYLWVAGIQAETSLPDMPPSTPPEAARFDTRISGGAMLAAQAHYRSVGLFVDFAWLQLDSAASHPVPAFSRGNLKSDFIHSTVALSYRLPLEGKFHAELLAGARLWYVSEDLKYQDGVLPGFHVSGDQTWVDPVFGADLSYDLSRRWSLVTRGTAGGAGSGLGWEVMGGVSYRFSDLCSTTFGYRYLHEDYEQNHFSINTDIQGFILGVGFHF
jgi:opacity protein-like surface antigen